MSLEESPEIIYGYYKDSVDDLEKAQKRNRGIRRVGRQALGLGPARNERIAESLHANQIRYSQIYAENNLQALVDLAEHEDSARNAPVLQ